MSADSQAVHLSHHQAAGTLAMLGEILDVYHDAWGPASSAERTEQFQGRVSKNLARAGFRCVTARAAGQLVGFIFGYPLPPDTYWWDGLVPEPAEGFALETGSRTVGISEFAVRRARQGRGIGRFLMAAYLEGRTEERAALATGADAPIQRLYESWGWAKVGQVPGRPGQRFHAYDILVRERPFR